MAWPSSGSLSKTNFDQDTDTPANARAQLEAMYDHVLAISNEVTDGATVWHSGNDGAASGLDSDLLDGQHGSYYQNASNLNAGTVPLARLPLGNGNGIDADLLDGYDGSHFLNLNNHTGFIITSQIGDNQVTQAKIGATAVGQAEIKELTSDTSLVCGGGTATTIKDIISAYGLYYVSAGGGFCLSTELRVTTPSAWRDVFSIVAFDASTATSSTGVQPRVLTGQTTGSSQTATARDVYIGASPPHSINGLDFSDLFVFLRLNDKGELIASWIASDPPWYNNGPTKTKPTRTTSTKKYINKLILPENFNSLDKRLQFLALADAKTEEVELDESIKNADMDLIPTPYIGNYSDDQIILLEPDGKLYQDLINIRNNGGDIMEIIHGGYIKIGEDSKAGSHQKPCRCRMKKVMWK